MKISYNGIPESGLEVINLERGAPFAYDSHYYIRVDLNCADIKDFRLPGKVIVVNLKWGSIRCLKNTTRVKPLQGKISLRDKIIHDCCGDDK